VLEASPISAEKMLQPALKTAETFCTFKVLHFSSATVALESAVLFRAL